MNILVLNSGSSSLKYQLFDMKKEVVLAKGLVERIGMKDAIVQYEPNNASPIKQILEILEHKEAIQIVLQMLMNDHFGVITSITDIQAVGHRIAHGGEDFTDSVIVDDEVISAIEKNIELAPLHNPANLKGIRAFREINDEIPMVCVFDTAFHQTMPAKSYMYPIPKILYHNHKIRRYGFHGTSHKYVSSRLEEICGRPLQESKVISCHIGNGASITAIKDGQSFDTSMGMTPLEGLMMGTRSGNIDPAIIEYVMMKDELTIDEVNSMLNKFSGLKGISGLSHDVREIINAMENGNKDAELAIDMYVYRMVKYIGSYVAAMNGVDSILFTGGVLENSAYIRKRICENLTFLGIDLDEIANNDNLSKERKITSAHSKASIYIIPTNEELMIARDTMRLLDNVFV